MFRLTAAYTDEMYIWSCFAFQRICICLTFYQALSHSTAFSDRAGDLVFLLLQLNNYGLFTHCVLTDILLHYETSVTTRTPRKQLFSMCPFPTVTK